MKGFELYWMDLKSKNISVLVKTNRKYSAILIDAKSAMKKLISLLERLPIKKIVTFCSLTSLEYHQILSTVSEKVVNIFIIGVSVPDIDQMKTFKLLDFKKLTTLKIKHNKMGADALLPFRSVKNLKSFRLENLRNAENKLDDITTVFQFLKAQQNLKSLDLDSSYNEIFTKKEFADALDLQLNKLSVNTLESEDLLKLLQKQNGLKKLSVNIMWITRDLMQYFLHEMKSLKNLIFLYLDFDVIDSSWTSKKNLMIEKITFWCDEELANEYLVPTIVTLLNVLPNLKVASFLHFPKNFLTEILLTIQTTAEKLEKLQFCRCEIPTLKLKQLKRAKFTECKERSVYDFLSVNKNVEAVIKYCE